MDAWAERWLRCRVPGLVVVTVVWLLEAAVAQVSVATFDVDATPPPRSALMYDPMREAGMLTLRCRGIVLVGAGEPVVLASVDWIGIANGGHDGFRAALAAAAGTSRSRVSVHAIHQHDAPICDSTAEAVLRRRGLVPGAFDSAVVEPTLRRAAEAVRVAMGQFRPVTHVGWGAADVREVASNRRILGPDGKVSGVRYTACTDPVLRAAPEGTIDPKVALVSFWNGELPVAVLSYYATHPQSYYRTGVANPDFPGVARFLREQAVPAALHLHFNGAGGNIGAGKYNDGAPTNRAVLARRLADGMERAWTSTVKTPVLPADVGWESVAVALPPASHLDRARLEATLAAGTPAVYVAASKLAFLEQCEAGRTIDIGCLRLGGVRVLHMPGELFVEYQLSAQAMRPDLHVAMAAYGDYGPCYIGTRVAYDEGGYETAPDSSLVAPSVEGVLMDAMKRLLGVP